MGIEFFGSFQNRSHATSLDSSEYERMKDALKRAKNHLEPQFAERRRSNDEEVERLNNPLNSGQLASPQPIEEVDESSAVNSSMARQL